MADPIATVTSVVNIRHRAYCDYYIGRPSIFGNPFHIGADGTRDEVIAKYEVYARDRLKHDPLFRAEVRNLYGKTLGCYCAPLRCHGHVLAKLTEELNRY
jgi:hypothetical protein